jgi:hypothetical protein
MTTDSSLKRLSNTYELSLKSIKPQRSQRDSMNDAQKMPQDFDRRLSFPLSVPRIFLGDLCGLYGLLFGLSMRQLRTQ